MGPNHAGRAVFFWTACFGPAAIQGGGEMAEAGERAPRPQPRAARGCEVMELMAEGREGHKG